MTIVVHDTMDPILQQRLVEVYEQPDGLLRKPQIGEQLLVMQCCKPLNRFNLHDEPAVHEQVDPEGSRKVQTVMGEIDRHLPDDGIANPLEATGQQRLVNGFQQPRAKIAMDSNSCIQNIATYLVDIARLPLRVSAPPREPTFLL